MADKPPVYEFSKNSRETYYFRLGEFKGHKFADMKIYATEPGENGDKPKDPAPTKKGLTVPPALWRQFRAALDVVEAAIIEAGWLNKADLADS